LCPCRAWWFLWISLYDVKQGPHCRRSVVVSILVLMDFPVWPSTLWVDYDLNKCFNPCSYGFPCMTLNLAHQGIRLVWFQSLFLWISLYDFYVHARSHAQLGFQSLFLWISLYDVLLLFLVSYTTDVSILVLMDFPVWQGRTRRRRSASTTFQSLFLWISLYDCVFGIRQLSGEVVSILVLMDFPVWQKNEAWRKSCQSSFNPCSYGFPCMTWCFPSFRIGMSKFQSLFLWISLYDTCRVCGIVSTDLVSILVLMDFPVWQEKKNWESILQMGFNPCSYGFPCMTASTASKNSR